MRRGETGVTGEKLLGAREKTMWSRDSSPYMLLSVIYFAFNYVFACLFWSCLVLPGFSYLTKVYNF